MKNNHFTFLRAFSMTLEEFRARFRVVDPLEAAGREPTKYYDPFVEHEIR